MPTEPRIRVEVAGRELELSNLDKVLYPESGFTKGEVIDYYTRVAPVLLPYLCDRALTRIRYPDGVDGPSFFEKNKPAGTPDWVRVERLPAPGSSKGRETIDYVVADDLPTLVWLANLAALELHTPQWRIVAAGSAALHPLAAPPEPVAKRGRLTAGSAALHPLAAPPDLLVFDLDPGAPAALAECCGVAVLIRDRLADDGVDSYPKTSGRKGMQLVCPIAGTQSAELVAGYAHRVADELADAVPKSITAKMAKRLRPGKVFIDWSQNNAAKTTVAAYSLRARPVPAVSAPLTWAEVEAAASRGATGSRGAAPGRGATGPGRAGAARQFTPAEVLDRIEEYGDLLAGTLDSGPEVPA